MPEVLTTPAQLHAALAAGRYPDGGAVRVLDVRWRLDRPDGRPDYLAGHIPGARYVDLDAQLAAHGHPEEGRHPLPAAGDLQDAVRSWGIDDGDTVVLYDDLKNLSSARGWWLLRHAGVTDVRLLDGSLRGWTAAGFALETGEPADVAPGTATLHYGALDVLPIEDVLDFAKDALLLDARAGERYRGEVEPIDPRAGHIPGAVSAPTTANVDEHGTFLSPERLRERFSALGALPGAKVGVYCGSGVTAAHEAVALSLAGYTPVLYPGSWSQWSNHPDLPLAVGDAPGA